MFRIYLKFISRLCETKIKKHSDTTDWAPDMNNTRLEKHMERTGPVTDILAETVLGQTGYLYSIFYISDLVNIKQWKISIHMTLSLISRYKYLSS